MTEKIPTANPAEGCPYCEYDKSNKEPCPDCGEQHDNEKDFKNFLEHHHPDAHPLDIKDNIGAYLAHKKQPDMVHNQHFALLTGDKTRGRKKRPDSWGGLGKSSKSCPFCKDFAALTADHPMKIDNLVNLQDMHDRNPEAFHKKLDGYIRSIEKSYISKLYDTDGCIYCKTNEIFKKRKIPTHKLVEEFRQSHHRALNSNPEYQKMSKEQRNEQLAAVEHDVKVYEIHGRKPNDVHDMIDHVKRERKIDEKNAATMAVSSPEEGKTCNCETGDHSNAGGQEHGMFNQDIGRQNWQGQGLPQPKQDKDSCQCDEKPVEANKVPNADARLGDDEDEKKKAYCQCNKVYDAEGKELKVVNPLHGARPTGIPKHEAANLDEEHGEHYGEIPRSNVGGRHNAPPNKQSKGDKWMSRHYTPEALQQHERTTYDPDLAEKLTANKEKGRFDKPETKLSDITDTDSFEDKMRKLHEISNDHHLAFDRAHRAGIIQHKPDPTALPEDKKNPKGKLMGNQGEIQELLRSIKVDKADDDEQITGTSTGAKKTPNPKKYLHKPSEHNPMGVINPQWTDWRAARRKQLKEGKRETDSKKLLENMSAGTKLNLQTQAKLISAGTQSINDQKRSEQNKKRKKMTKQQLAARRKRLLGKAILKIKAMLERLKTERGDGTWGMRGLGEGQGTTDVQGSGDTHLISPVKQEELDRAMAGARYYPRSVSRKKPEPDIYQ